MMTKAELRREIAQRRKTLDPQWMAEASRTISDRLAGMAVFRTAERVGLYKAIPGEVDLDPLFETCWKAGKRTCIPVFNRESNWYELAEVTAMTRFRTGHYGIAEPSVPDRIPVEEIDLMAVPGVAFDPSGGRLGRGGGYYDRLLAPFRGTAVAVAFDFQLVERLPREPHDLPVDFVATEIRLIKVQNER